ncbi:uncharacterized protein (DUF58 family) [Pacificitalea manganoxidans]|nr:DUF58 domain-containing protein [Pacificitalea manganoxidans]MDR6306978.1 uncharacterized protein (DUF58 family) [Pacificitalea manganoxidans]
MIQQSSAHLRSRAEGLASSLPPLLADAQQLAATVVLGAHGRRRSGTGDEFWQYRPMTVGDEARMIDWRRSARSDGHFVREREWQAAQSVMIWVDDAQSMAFTGDPNRALKSDRARLLALAMSVLLVDGGERVGLSHTGQPPRSGPVQLIRIAEALTSDRDTPEYGAPETRGLPPGCRCVFLSDFMGDMAPVEAAMAKAADRGVRGAMLQILDPVEEAFPYDGRTIFESIGGTIRHETLKAGDLRDRYLERLAARKDRLDMLTRQTGWHYSVHHTDHTAQSALLWLYAALERGR